MGASKTQVISKANLSFPLADRYISFLLSKGHLRLGLDHRGVRRYTLTSKGERLLGFLAEIQRELEELFPNTSAAILTVAALSHGSLFDLDLRQGEGWRIVYPDPPSCYLQCSRVSGWRSQFRPMARSGKSGVFKLQQKLDLHNSIWKLQNVNRIEWASAIFWEPECQMA